MAFYLSFWRSLYLENREWCANIGQHCCLVIPGWSCFGQPCSTLHSDTALISMLEWEDPGHHQKGQEMVLSGGGFTMLLVDLRPELVQSWFVPNGTENYLDLRPQIADPDRQLDMDHTKTLSHAKSRVGKQAKRNVSTFGWFSWLKLPFGGYPYCPTPPKRHTQLSNTILSEVTLRAVDAIPEGVRPSGHWRGKWSTTIKVRLVKHETSMMFRPGWYFQIFNFNRTKTCMLKQTEIHYFNVHWELTWWLSMHPFQLGFEWPAGPLTMLSGPTKIELICIPNLIYRYETCCS